MFENIRSSHRKACEKGVAHKKSGSSIDNADRISSWVADSIFGILETNNCSFDKEISRFV